MIKVGAISGGTDDETKMRFLLINQYYAPDYAATAQQMADLCERLVAAGHEVHVISSQALYDGRDIALSAEETINGVHVHRVKISTSARRRFRERLMGYMSFYWNAFMRAHSLPCPDVVVTLTTPPMISLLGMWLRLLRRSRFVYWVMDVYPDIATLAGVLSPWSPITWVWGALARLSYAAANTVVVLGSDMKRALMGKGVPERKIQVIQSWASGVEIHPLPAEKNAFRRDHIDPAAFTLMYSGNMGTCHCFESVVEGIRSMGEGEPFRFLFVGSGKREAELREQLETHKTQVQFLPYQDRSMLSHSLSAPDAHLVTLEPTYDGLLVPSKLYGIMAAARPVVFIGSANNEVAAILAEARCGIRVEPNDPQGFVEAMRHLAAHPEEAQAMGERGRRYFERWFESDRACERFIRLLEETATRPGWRGARRLAHGVTRRPTPAPLPEAERTPAAFER